MSLTLPKIKAVDAIVDDKGRPTLSFLRYFNLDFAKAIERNEAAQEVIISDLQQVTNDLALAQQDILDTQDDLQDQIDRLTAFLNGTGEQITSAAALTDDLVPTAKMATGAVNQFTSTYTDGNVDISSGLGWVTVATVVVTTIADETVDLDGEFSFSRDTGVTAEMTIAAAWFKDGVQMAAQANVGEVDYGTGFTMPAGKNGSKINDTPGAGTFTYTLRANAQVTAGAYVGSANRRYGRALTLRKPG